MNAPDSKPGSSKRPGLFAVVMLGVLCVVAGIAWLISRSTGNFIGVYGSLLWFMVAAFTLYSRRGRGWRRVDKLRLVGSTVAAVLLAVAVVGG